MAAAARRSARRCVAKAVELEQVASDDDAERDRTSEPGSQQRVARVLDRKRLTELPLLAVQRVADALGRTRVIQGLERTRGYFAAITDTPLADREFRSMTVHETAGGEVTTTGEPYVLHYVNVLAAHDGEIAATPQAAR